MAKLVYGSQGRHFKLAQDLVVIGRSEDFAQLAINDKRLSRKHAELYREGDNWYVKDLGSRNGTRVNNRAVLEKPLEDGDEISLGGLTFKFLKEDAPPPQPAAPKPDINEPAPPPPGKNYSLKLLQGTLNTMLIPISNFPFTIGRKPANDLPLDGDKQSSGAHARLEVMDDGSVILVDLNSTNGTKVNGKLIKRAVLQDGAKLTIGSQLFRFDAGTDSGDQGAESPAAAGADAGGLQFADDDDDVPELSLGDDEGSIEFASSAETVDSQPAFDSIDGGAADTLDIQDDGSLDDDALDDVTPLPPKANVAASVASDGDDQGERSQSTGDDLARLDEIAVDSEGTGSNALVMVLNSFFGLLVLGAIGGFVFLTTSNAYNPNAGDDEFPGNPIGEGGLLNYHTFEAPEGADPGSSIQGWTQLQTFQYDNARAEPNPAISGKQVLAIQRQGPSAERTLWVNVEKFSVRSDDEPVSTPIALKGSVHVQMPSGKSSAFMFIEWYSDKDPVNPMRRDYRGYISPAATSGSGEESATGEGDAAASESGAEAKWHQTSAVFYGPPNATRARFGVGVTGGIGQVNFDGAHVARADVEQPARLQSVGALGMMMEQDATFTAEAANGDPLFQRAWLEFGGATARDVGRKHYEWLVSHPVIERGSGGLSYTLSVFDPQSQQAREIQASVSGSTFSASFSDAPTSLRWVIEPAAKLMPAGCVVLDRSGRGLRSGLDFASEGASRIELIDTSNAIDFSGGVYCTRNMLGLFSAGGAISCNFSVGENAMRLNNLLAIYGAQDENGQWEGLKRVHHLGVESADSARRRELVDTALLLAAEFPSHRPALAAAEEAVKKVASNYQIRQTDLSDVIGEGRELVRNVDLYLNAVNRALTYREELEDNLNAWIKSAGPLLQAMSARSSGGYPLENLQAIREMLKELTRLGAELPGQPPHGGETTLGRFYNTVRSGEDRAFNLNVERQIVDARPELALALDHVKQGNAQQARLKLYSILERYPMSDASTEAQMHLLQIAQEFSERAQELSELGLSNSARTESNKAKEIILDVRLARDFVAVNAFETMGRDEFFSELEAHARSLAGAEVASKDLRVMGVVLDDWRRRDREVANLLRIME